MLSRIARTEKLIRPHEAGEGDRTKCGGGGASLDFEEDIDRSHCFWADAPSTTLLRSVVPLPRCRGEGWDERAPRER